MQAAKEQVSVGTNTEESRTNARIIRTLAILFLNEMPSLSSDARTLRRLIQECVSFNVRWEFFLNNFRHDPGRRFDWDVNRSGEPTVIWLLKKQPVINREHGNRRRFAKRLGRVISVDFSSGRFSVGSDCQIPVVLRNDCVIGGKNNIPMERVKEARKKHLRA